MPLKINCDLGESLERLNDQSDKLLMQYVDAINIACGYHAGSEYIINRTIENALDYSLEIGAHPGYNDPENFGRMVQNLTEIQLKDLIFSQLDIIYKIAAKHNVKIKHIKPHGALYNLSAIDAAVAKTIARAVFEYDRNLVLYGLSGSESIIQAKNVGLKTAAEVFADRMYNADGTLVSRTQKNAVLETEEQVSQQVSFFVNKEMVQTSSGDFIKLEMDTICIHSDSPNSLILAKEIRKILG
jgi:5-oxoprolinase (ATP-hydrolysing) subunit A